MKPNYRKEVMQFTPGKHKSCCLTMDWYAVNALYPPRPGVKVTPLINGEVAFGAMYEAIQQARQSVEIISWGFDPAMRFTPGGERIGELLDSRGRHGVKSRVLIWKNPAANFLENTVIGDGLAGSGGTAAGSGPICWR